ncbi:sigma-70 family RNA polymerase sigma factor [Azoarcus sp. TTM-91]|uniref:RNA polymerase sigma factor n=1 Tax=Azoarcus sp. TTM-91 TaxID=2691581 RepID=UPI00145F15F4|nr:RNA polymerase sigma factor [Azoarcus sp. TTM-91]NMG35325.1 sigma-70 family RNA polymerase sigma factor [Azoarcus sp. TTM-91]
MEIDVRAGAGALPEGAGLRAYLAANYRELQRRLARRFGCADLASECLHETWLRLGDMTTAAIRCPEAYVYRAASNVAMERLRDRDARPGAALEEADLEQLADSAPGPEQTVEARSELAAMERALHGLPRRHRAILLALRVEDCSRQEAAAWYRVSVRTLDAILGQALRHCAHYTARPRSGGAAPADSGMRCRVNLAEERQAA